MILTYRCEFGVPLRLNLNEALAGNIEIECIEFINALPIDWRFVTSDGQALTEWKPGRREGMGEHLRGLHDLQRPRNSGGTCGLEALDAILETRGIGKATLFVWPREGTYREKAALQLTPISCHENLA
jgi:hypothetical protein